MKFATIIESLDNAALNTTPIPQWADENQFSLKDAYEIQQGLIQQRINRGHSLIGIKMGFTSFAKMEQMGVHDMIWGRLTKDMFLNPEDKLCLDSFIHPRAEPEICFRVAKDIDREISIEEAKNDYIDGVAASIEIIDSRYKNFKFSLAGVIADNCSSASFVVGDWQSVDTEIDNNEISMLFDQEEVATGNSNAILGNPWLSVNHASRLANANGMVIKAGSYLLAGAATSAVFLKRNQKITAKIDGFPDLSFFTE
jgi:2-oxo-3-hexenedioate decarboxylase